MDPRNPDTKDDDASPEAPFPIVGIGASAGGLDALQKLLGRLSGDGMAYVVAQHLAAGRESALTEILARATAMPVVTIHEEMAVEAGRVYVAPPDVELGFRDGKFLLTDIGAHAVPRRTIDAFFRALAAERGRMAIGVVLSGSGSDGTLGLRCIKEEGGITFVQEPPTALQPSMPQAAIDAGVADFCLSPGEIGDELMRLAAHPYVGRGLVPRAVDEASVDQILTQLRQSFDIDFAAYKRGTLERRIHRRMVLRRLDSLAEYARFAEEDPSELALLFSDVLIGVTAFFRDGELFDALKKDIFPRLLERRGPDSPIRVWVPGCSTGEEAYSIAIALLEVLGERAATQRVQIFATDIDEQALARARQALYPRNLEAGLSPERLQTWFSLEEQGYRVSRRVRDTVVFARHNLGRDPPFSRLDLVSCRNVLIYMQPPLQRRILRVFHYALKPGGVLVLGLSESVGDAADLFRSVDRKLKIYQREEVADMPGLELGFTALPAGAAPSASPRPEVTRPLLTIQQIADRKLLDRYAPPGVLVDESLDVLQFRGRTGPFLEPVPGLASLNVLKLVRAELMPVVRTTVHEAARVGQPVTSPPVRVGQGPELSVVCVDVVPVLADRAGQPAYLVLFKTQAPQPEAEAEGAETRNIDPRIEALERELVATKASLQATIEEMEVTNEELQSANEELQSANEELQSTNEELETSKEELQSTNEELATVNDELQSRMNLLGATRDDLKNVLTGVSSAVLIVGADLRIRSFSSAAERLLNLIPSDVGRPIAYVRTAMMARDIDQTVAQVIETATPREQRVRGTDGHWYAMRVLPYRTSDNAIRGATIELARAAATARAPSPGDLGDVAIEVLAALPHALCLLDDQVRVFWGNSAFLKYFRLEGDVFGRPLDELWNGRNDEPELWTLLEETSSGGNAFSNVLVERPFRASGAPPMLFSARQIPAAADRPPLTLVVMEPRPTGDEDAGGSTT